MLLTTVPIREALQSLRNDAAVRVGDVHLCAQRDLVQQRAGEPAGGGARPGSNGSRVAPQLGSVRGA